MMLIMMYVQLMCVSDKLKDQIGLIVSVCVYCVCVCARARARAFVFVCARAFVCLFRVLFFLVIELPPKF